MQVCNFIGGKSVGGDQWFTVTDPGDTGVKVARVAEADEQAVIDCIAQARQAQRRWRQESPEARAVALARAAEVLEARGSELATLLSREQGMLLRDTQRDARNGASALREAARIGPEFCQPGYSEDDTARIEVTPTAYGVVAAIIPWNAPMSLAMGKIGPALVTGNTIIIKPSPLAPAALTEAVTAIAGCFPPGVVNVVHGTEGAKLLVRHPDVRKIAFTGSIATGQTIMASASSTIKSVTMELGGNDPALVLEDAAPDQFAEAILRQALARSGQVCYAIKRVYVPASRYQSWVEAFVECAQERVVGYGQDPQSSLAPVITAEQKERLLRLAENAREDGATVTMAGRRSDRVDWENGHYLQPRIVSHIAPDHPLVTGEQFGPILPVIAYNDIDEAIRLCNNTPYGLGASVWGNDTERARQVIGDIESGVGFINSHSRTPLGDREMPFGGIKSSGLGRNRTAIGLREYVETRAISLKKR